jgi:hypothetical protein
VQYTDENGLIIRVGLDPSMRMEEGEGGGEPAPAADPAPAEVTPDPATAPEADPFEDDTKDTFDRDYVTKLRAENAKHRTAAKEATTRAEKFEATFSDLDEATTEGLLGLVAALKSGDPAAVPVLESILADLTPAQAAELQDAIDDDTTPQFKTQEELDAYLEARDAKKEAAQAEKDQFLAMKAEVESLGYSLDEEKPNVDTSDLFFFLGQQPKDQPPNIEAAHKEVQARKAQWIEEYKASINEKNSRFARIATAGATPVGADGGKKPKTREDASKAAMEFLANAE